MKRSMRYVLRRTYEMMKWKVVGQAKVFVLCRMNVDVWLQNECECVAAEWMWMCGCRMNVDVWLECMAVWYKNVLFLYCTTDITIKYQNEYNLLVYHQSIRQRLTVNYQVILFSVYWKSWHSWGRPTADSIHKTNTIFMHCSNQLKLRHVQCSALILSIFTFTCLFFIAMFKYFEFS